MQLSHSKAMEIEDLLGRLSDVNDSLSSSLSGASDPRSHTLARHRDILHDYTQARSSVTCKVCVIQSVQRFICQVNRVPVLPSTCQMTCGAL